MNQRQGGCGARRAITASIFVVALCGSVQAQWPQWGGPNRDFIADATGLAESWPESGPKELWKRDLGEGYSSVLVDGGRLYTMYRSADDAKEVVIALDAGSGDTLWEYKYDAAPAEGHADQFGRGPRSTPLIVGDRIYTIGVSGKMHCLNKHDGKPYWSKGLWDEFGGNILQHGYSSSPIAYKGTVIVLAGGEGASLIAFDKTSGSVVWKSQDIKNGYSTPILIEFEGSPQLVTFMREVVIGVNPDNGSLEWTYDFDGTNMAQPIWDADENTLFVSALRVGTRALKMTRQDGKIVLKEVWKTRKVQFYHVNPIAVGDYVYGSSGGGPCFLAAINRKTGKVAWRKRGFAMATAVMADGKFIILDEDGQLAIIRATPDSFEVLSQVSLLDEVAWTVPTVVGKKLYLRDKKTIRALDLS